MSNGPRRSREKIVSAGRARIRAEEARARGEVVVFTNGCFDLLHTGHLRCLEEARRQGDCLIVGINRDESVREAKGLDRPIMAVGDRMQLVAGLECVDWVVAFSTPTPLPLILAIRPEVLAKGGDWSPGEIVGRKEVEAWGGRVKRLRLTAARSTTLLVDKIRRDGPRHKR